MRTKKLAEGIVEILIASLTTMIVFSFPSRNNKEIIDNLVWGALVGIHVWVITFISSYTCTFITNRFCTIKSKKRYFIDLSVSFLIFLLIIFILSKLFSKPFWGSLSFLLWGALFNLPVQSFFHVFGFSVKLALAVNLLLVMTLSTATIIISFYYQHPSEIYFNRTDTDKITVLSWNIGSGFPLGCGSKEEQLYGIAQTVKKYKADIVCLQELGGQEHLRILINELGNDWKGICSQNAAKATAILTKISGTFLLPNTKLIFSGPSEFVINSMERNIRFLSVHLRPGGASKDRRDYIKWLTEYSCSSEHFTVISGDFNVDPDCMWDRISPLFSDDILEDQKSLDMLKNINYDPGKKCSSTCALSRRIDRIFLPNQIICSKYQIVLDASQGWMDHKPIVVFLTFKKNRSFYRLHTKER